MKLEFATHNEDSPCSHAHVVLVYVGGGQGDDGFVFKRFDCTTNL